jgi:hypothetical protein
MLFKAFMMENKEALKSNMMWNNYNLNSVLLPLEDDLKEHALRILSQNYGKFEVGDILDEMQADIFSNFPLLMRSLSVSTSMTFQSTGQHDIENESRTVTESGKNKNNSLQTNNTQRETTGKSTLAENNSINGKTSNIGSVSTHEASVRNETDTTIGNNTTTTPTTGSKNVVLNHSMPEQSIDGVSVDFTKDSQGTPDLNLSTVQNGSENYSTINQFQNIQSINQSNTIHNDITNDNTRTDDTAQITDNTTETHNTNDTIGQESIVGGSNIEGANETEHITVDTVNRELVNKQYAQEITDILKNVHSVKSFDIWVDSFSWVCGVY